MSRKKFAGPMYSISVVCANCNTVLYKYQKEGPGKLVKCYVDRIAKDYTKGDLLCPKCGQQFARHAIIHSRPAHKMIGGKVLVKGHCKK